MRIKRFSVLLLVLIFIFSFTVSLSLNAYAENEGEDEEIVMDLDDEEEPGDEDNEDDIYNEDDGDDIEDVIEENPDDEDENGWDDQDEDDGAGQDGNDGEDDDVVQSCLITGRVEGDDGQPIPEEDAQKLYVTISKKSNVNDQVARFPLEQDSTFVFDADISEIPEGQYQAYVGFDDDNPAPYPSSKPITMNIKNDEIVDLVITVKRAFVAVWGRILDTEGNPVTPGQQGRMDFIVGFDNEGLDCVFSNGAGGYPINEDGTYYMLYDNVGGLDEGDYTFGAECNMHGGFTNPYPVDVTIEEGAVINQDIQLTKPSLGGKITAADDSGYNFLRKWGSNDQKVVCMSANLFTLGDNGKYHGVPFADTHVKNDGTFAFGGVEEGDYYLGVNIWEDKGARAYPYQDTSPLIKVHITPDKYTTKNIALKSVLEIEAVSTKSEIVWGKAPTGTSILVKSGSKVLNKAYTGKNGEFYVYISKQNKDTKLEIACINGDGDKLASKAITVKDSKALAQPSVNAVKNTSKYVEGKSTKGYEIIILKVDIDKDGDGKVVYPLASGIVNSKGEFKITIKSEKAGVELIVFARDKNGIVSPANKVTVKR